MPTGTLTVTGAGTTIAFERRLAHPIERVWAALTDPGERARWFGRTTIDPREGGRVETIAEGPPVSETMRTLIGRILVWDPPHVLEHEWQQTTIGFSTVRYELRAEGGETILRLTHHLSSAAGASGYIPGEHAYLDRLQAHLEGAPLPDWTARYEEVRLLYSS
ncbi:MAG: SRPBCC family protein [Candidatus Dormibacteraeota bacterium]|nr:SRPBCC family protein [Candidatus Dormibacteraeota bacterium]MBO0760198.1 SRPBCC family protein [Candidatus Dormibacteraeota bacterium]